MRGLTLRVTNNTTAPLTISDVTGLETFAAGETRNILYTSEIQASLEYGRLNSLITSGAITVSFVSGTNLNQAPIGRTFTGASPVATGDRGLVPQAAIAQRTYYLRGDGTWSPITSLGIGAIPQSLLTTPGDLIVRGLTTAERLPLGSLGYVLRSGPVTAQWAAMAASGTTAARPSPTGYYSGTFYWTTDAPALFVCAHDGTAWLWYDLGVFGVSVQQDGTQVGTHRTINFIDSVVVTDDPGNERVNVSIQSTVQRNGVLIGKEPKLNFTGSVTAIDEPGNNRVTIHVTGGGGGGGFPDPLTIWVWGAGPAGGDGSMGDPFNTIQAACNAVPAGSRAVVMLASGTYDEDLAITGTDRDITLCGLGDWTLGGGMATGNITWTIETETTVRAVLRICSVQNAGGASPFVVAGGRPVISGTVTAVTSSTPTIASLTITGTVNGGIDATSLALASVPLILRLDRAAIGGPITGDTTSLIYAEEGIIVGAVSVNLIAQVVRCVFFSTITMVTSMSPPGPFGQSGFYACTFNGDITGPGGGSVYMDGSSYWSVINNGVSILGDTLQVVDNNYVPANVANWSVPVPGYFGEGLDQLAARVKAIEVSGVPSTLTEDFASSDPLIAVGDAVYHEAVTDTVKRADATSAATAPARGIVVALLPGPAVRVKWQGSVGGYVGLVTGATYYLAIGTPGGITNADTSLGPPGSICQEVGYARNATTLFVMVDADYIVN